MTVYFGEAPSTGSRVGSSFATLIGGLFNMFAPRSGLPQTQTWDPAQPNYVAPLPGQAGYVEPTPAWVYVLIPVGIIGALVMIKKSRRKSVGGYRRKSRRSRR